MRGWGRESEEKMIECCDSMQVYNIHVNRPRGMSI